MPYDPMMVQPMRDDMTSMNVEELRGVSEVDAFMSREGTKLVFVNSVCGCAAGQARPALRIALQNTASPAHSGTVFAGQDLEATTKVRNYFVDVPPSSPSIGLFKDGALVHFIPRHMIENRDAQAIAFDLVTAFDEYCAS